MITTISWIAVLSVMRTQRHDDMTSGTTNEALSVSVAATELAVTDKTLELRYQIKNDATYNIWICESMDVGNPWGDFEAYVGEDNETLFVQRRLNVPMNGSRTQPIGRYVRLGSGETRAEVMSFSLPVYERCVLFGTRGRRPAEYAKRLVLEIGYYESDLPALVFRTLEEESKTPPTERDDMPAYGTGVAGMIGGPLYFSVGNEQVRARDEQALIPWTDQVLKGEKVLQMTIDGLLIPYRAQQAKPRRIHLSPCKRIDIRFSRSPLKFFFPYSQEQDLLSREEQEYLQSLKDLSVQDSWGLMGVAYDMSQGIGAAFFTERGRADLACYRKDGSVVSLILFDGEFVLAPEGQVFRCPSGLPGLRKLLPRVQSFDLRMRCAGKLKNLWHRFRLYRIARHAPRDVREPRQIYERSGQPAPPDAYKERDDESLYPPPAKWCDALLQGYRVSANGDDTIAAKEYECPGAGEGKCHYAMNPNCHVDSPGDMVLLFETNAGWNQRGGPELFTFDNHDPKGGCVLLNDGTVKFVRTEEELKQLRWK